MRLAFCAFLLTASFAFADGGEVAKPIGIAPATFSAVEPTKSAKPVPRELAKGIKYVVHWHDPLAVGFISLDGGTAKITDRRGPRAYAKEKTITDQGPDADNEDIVTIQDTFIYELTAETSGNVIVLATPALKNDKDGKQAAIVFSDTVQRFLKLTGTPAPVEPLPSDDEATSAIRNAYTSERDAEMLAKLAKHYRNSVGLVDSSKSWGEFFRKLVADRKAAVGESLSATRDAVGAVLFDKRWPNQSDRPLVDADRQLIKDGLNQAAKILEAIR